MRHLFAALLSLLALPQGPDLGLPFRTPEGAYAVLHFKTLDAGATSHAAAVDVLIDGRRDQIVLLTPGVKRNDYDMVVGPLNAGSHGAQLVFSSLWPRDQALRIGDVSIDVVAPGDPRFEIFANAPAIGVRPDTIGTASDLPLLMYVEQSTEGDSRWLRYSVIFSNEDGGTPGAALMSRWGRTTDIELAYEVELRNGRIAQARYQGPDHRVIANERLDVHPPSLLVSTLNNMFLDRGRSAATVRMAPIQVDLSTRSRESVMDDHPWIYRVMARELATERPAGVGDPRDYVYVDLRLTSRAAGVALGLRGDGTTWWSDRGRADLVVSRQGEMRIAIPAPAQERASSLSIRCDPRPEPNRSADTAQCDAEVRKAFRLDTDHQPGPSLISPARLTIAAGTARDLAFHANRIE
jgi:hypothetical protein